MKITDEMRQRAYAQADGLVYDSGKPGDFERITDAILEAALSATTDAVEPLKPLMVEGEHLMAYVSRILQAAGGEEEDPVCALIVEAVQIARGDDLDRVFLAEVVKWAARAYAERLAPPAAVPTDAVGGERLEGYADALPGAPGAYRFFTSVGFPKHWQRASLVIHRAAEGKR